MMKEDYIKLNERAGYRGEWRHWMYEPAWNAENQEEESMIIRRKRYAAKLGLLLDH